MQQEKLTFEGTSLVFSKKRTTRVVNDIECEIDVVFNEHRDWQDKTADRELSEIIIKSIKSKHLEYPASWEYCKNHSDSIKILYDIDIDNIHHEIVYSTELDELKDCDVVYNEFNMSLISPVCANLYRKISYLYNDTYKSFDITEMSYIFNDKEFFVGGNEEACNQYNRFCKAYMDIYGFDIIKHVGKVPSDNYLLSLITPELKKEIYPDVSIFEIIWIK